MKTLVSGGGGFIGGYLVKDLLKQGHEVVCADIKKIDNWYQVFEEAENHVSDMRLKEEAYKLTEGVDRI